MILNPDFREFIKLLGEHKVDHMIIGGYALAYHGYPRFTQDIDFWIWTNPENISRLLSVLSEFGFQSLGLKSSDFLEGENVIQLGYPPNRIDIVTAIDGVTFDTAYSNKEVLLDEDVMLHFISIDELIKNKKASGRHKDLADLEVLLQLKRKRERESK